MHVFPTLELNPTVVVPSHLNSLLVFAIPLPLLHPIFYWTAIPVQLSLLAASVVSLLLMLSLASLLSSSILSTPSALYSSLVGQAVDSSFFLFLWSSPFSFFSSCWSSLYILLELVRPEDLVAHIVITNSRRKSSQKKWIPPLNPIDCVLFCWICVFARSPYSVWLPFYSIWT